MSLSGTAGALELLDEVERLRRENVVLQTIVGVEFTEEEFCKLGRANSGYFLCALCQPLNVRNVIGKNNIPGAYSPQMRRFICDECYESWGRGELVERLYRIFKSL